MAKKVAFLTTIFPMEKEYLLDFFDSLEKQTCQDFDIVVVNDGYDNFDEIISSYKSLNIIEVKYSDTPSKNREFGIKFVQKNKYDILIFGDSDDYFETNRVQISLDKLKKYDIVVNDLTLFGETGTYCANYFSRRIKNNTRIKAKFIKDKNIFGLSNSAVKVPIMWSIFFDKDLVVIDWYLFSILLLRNFSAVFTNETTTYYRQHEENTIGLSVLTTERVSKCLQVRIKHYKLLQEDYSDYKKLYAHALWLQSFFVKENVNIDELKIENPLWWEEIEAR